MTHLHAGHPRVAERLTKLTDPGVGTTIITKVALLRGRMDRVLKASSGDDILRAQYLLRRTEDSWSRLSSSRWTLRRWSNSTGFVK
jgi:tRNA(fMet)-specific endonuclease VapC